MFLGVLHANARKILASYIPALPAHVHVLCSGNFTVETTLRMNSYHGRLSGCDVALYTCALGCCFTDQSMMLALDIESFPEFAPLAAYLDTPVGKAASVSIALEALQFHRRKNPYENRMMDAYAARWPALLEGTIKRLAEKKKAIQLDEFHSEDAWKRISAVLPDAEHCIVTFPPTYKQGYERLYKDLDRLFVWQDRPAYRELTSGAEFARQIIARPGPWIIGAEKPTPDMERMLGPPVALSPRSSDVVIRLYSNLMLKPHLVSRRIKAVDGRWARLSGNDEITDSSRLTIHRVPANEAQYIRGLFSSPQVAQAQAPYSYAVALDGKLIGVLGFDRPDAIRALAFLRREGLNYVYMLADVTISSVRYPRLSKLVLLAALSVEIRHDLEGLLVNECAWNVTTAFSRHPASMKYRGLFALASRKQREDGIYVLNYYAPMGKQTLHESLLQWLRKSAIQPATLPA